MILSCGSLTCFRPGKARWGLIEWPRLLTFNVQLAESGIFTIPHVMYLSMFGVGSRSHLYTNPGGTLTFSREITIDRSVKWRMWRLTDAVGSRCSLSTRSALAHTPQCPCAVAADATTDQTPARMKTCWRALHPSNMSCGDLGCPCFFLCTLPVLWCH